MAKKEFQAESKKLMDSIKVTGGSLKAKQLINGEKINQIRIYSGEKYTSVNEAHSFRVVLIFSLSFSASDIFSWRSTSCFWDFSRLSSSSWFL